MVQGQVSWSLHDGGGAGSGLPQGTPPSPVDRQKIVKTLPSRSNYQISSSISLSLLHQKTEIGFGKYDAFNTCGVLRHYSQIVHLYCTISTRTGKFDHVILSIINLLKQFSYWMVHCTHVVHYKYVPIDLKIDVRSIFISTNQILVKTEKILQFQT